MPQIPRSSQGQWVVGAPAWSRAWFMLRENAGDLATASLSFVGFCLGSVPCGPAIFPPLVLPAGLEGAGSLLQVESPA